MAQNHHQANYDESKVPEYTLPELLKSESGKAIKTREDWEKLRRPEILQLFKDHVYGAAPGRPESMRFKVTKSLPEALEGKARLKEVTIEFFDGKEGAFIDLLVLTPKGAKGKVPCFLMCNFGGNHRIHSSQDISLTRAWMSKRRGGDANGNATEASRAKRAEYFSIDHILESGYGLATFHAADVNPDRKGFTDGIHPYFYKEGQTEPGPKEWRTLSAWAWGLSRALDYLEADEHVDAKKVAVMGHSRLGKTALWAGAQDERFALVISNNSGCGGAALSRRCFGERVARINQSFPYWFCDTFKQYDHKESELPVDQHMLLALMAPRPVYVASATEDKWADPKGEFLSAVHAQPVYELYGYKPVLEKWPDANTAVMGRVGYHLREGKHAVRLFDWQQYIRFANQHL